MRYAAQLSAMLVSEGFVDVEEDLPEDEPLLSSGLLDSMELIRLIGRLNDEFGILIKGADLANANFETCVSMSRLLERLITAPMPSASHPAG
ncbi:MULTISPECIES: acyl carrier protein [unclassified Pseudofrankia]|uniref:acyl carrier protein n=1 Tax=unclassified Pseudofrankia TaxID=2994372 RepID=UPI0008DA4363|nr:MULTISPECIES: acyl carrier protein [unclassified Pseudofrankia]MDT3440821.1 acyl carrier protein [Pseudofrankia sp. BMG5.37]OHV43665.1 hypothetical protein BCD48_27145 [Pseudofrankia sp. BMG5.36]